MSARIISILFLLGAMLASAMAVPAVKSDRPAIPEDLFYEFKAIPDDENAIICWHQAAEVFMPLTPKERQLLQYSYTPDMPTPSADDLAGLQNWRKRNQEALRLFDASLQKTKAQWPKSEPQKTAPELMVLSQMIRAHLWDADQLAEQGQWNAAARLLEDSLRMAQLGVAADDGMSLNYALSGLQRNNVQGAMLRLASQKSVPVALIREMLGDLPGLDQETNDYSRMLRVSFSTDYLSSYDANLLAKAWSKYSETDSIMAIFPEDLRHPFKVLLDPSLVFQHPNALDPISTMENDIRHERIQRTNSFSAWTNRCAQVDEDRDAMKAKLLEDIQPLMALVKDEPLPLSRQAVARARDAYLKIENPLGRILSLSSPIADDTRVFQFRTEREATRTILALLIFERQNGLLPAKLADLVEKQILAAVPTDPFSGAPMRYSRERQIVWSVGKNGVDDNGNGGPTHWSGDDAVWDIPKLN